MAILAFWAFISFRCGLLGLHFLSFWPFGPSFPFIFAFWAFISFHFCRVGFHLAFRLSFLFILAFWAFIFFILGFWALIFFCGPWLACWGPYPFACPLLNLQQETLHWKDVTL